MAATGFHEGELAAQRRAGVETQALRLEGMLGHASLSSGAAKFLAQQTFAVMTARDGEGLLWTSPLTAAAGFLQGRGDVLHVGSAFRDGDPLSGILAGQQVGMLAIDFATRRRMRINGVLAAADAAGLVVQVDQAFGNCPQYIHPRTVDVPILEAAPTAGARHETSLSEADRVLITAADTFFLGTTHPTRGNDASHRGGPRGFVRVDSPDRLWWPDYPGNNMFNSFGNLAVDDEAAMLFVDFESGASLHVSGRAQVQWTNPDTDGADGAARGVRFWVDSVVALGTSAVKRAERSS
ncbi:pyridoxamine 5'-phosphate oxidase family protein [Mycobacterium asiaticum]|uniref:Pyridoxamine 5'-phosphate oxidase n=1 Tax=Mycobacterium asiaticum TaxID=1790 RepID=A0A1A3CT34_MYCAS|nr:pyridoxamine 5'-phosphate oxidase family protein [Mycobacterium asiaticum]OBI89542.1 pyridoxamine 5'-phosphate oxidase [Mycobacterium asiaticum]